MNDDQRNLVLTGFMGTGKSTIGRLVAAKLGRPFIDMDEVIVERAGMSIPEIFRRYGEAEFRRRERALCAELSQQHGLVIATGGGALVDPENRATMAQSGCLVCLDCAEEELLRRLHDDQGRPMLWGNDPAQRLRELLQARRSAYAQIPYHIDTTHQTKEESAAQVLRLYQAQPKSWSVQTPTGNYYVHLIPGGLEYLGALLRIQGVRNTVAVVSDEHVWPLYGDQVLSSLQQSDYKASAIVLPAGERYKTLETVRTLYDRFVEAELDRSGAVVALGGGVITDMAGFAAATFMRGVGLVQVPTTLLGMVDASVGGKVAVDHPQGKNLIGAFVRPLFVLLDPATLETLPEPEHRAGLAEVIKAGIIADPTLFAALEPPKALPAQRWLVERALAVKIAVVEEDPYERGRRAVLNLGHTFAHAFEVLANYKLAHGLAVSIGMVAAAYLAEEMGLCTSETRARIQATLAHHGLPIHYAEHPPKVIYQAMRTDKKRRGKKLRFILPREIGQVEIVSDIPPEKVHHALERIRS
ncbi:MAG: 3-dehydroquinate synthase [Anaerolineae bacterium]|nr:3-dehydroquinate synthase [Anaerolineae bacterium]